MRRRPECSKNKKIKEKTKANEKFPEKKKEIFTWVRKELCRF
jgi:hypothetical protein